MNIVYDSLVHPNKTVSNGTIELDEGIGGRQYQGRVAIFACNRDANLEIPMQSGTLQGD